MKKLFTFRYEFENILKILILRLKFYCNTNRFKRITVKILYKTYDRFFIGILFPAIISL